MDKEQIKLLKLQRVEDKKEIEKLKERIRKKDYRYNRLKDLILELINNN